MDWKLLLIGLAMIVAGSVLAWRFRKSKYGSQTGPGCVMAFALLMLITGVMALVVGLMFRVTV